jgi:hypothetical protein
MAGYKVGKLIFKRAVNAAGFYERGTSFNLGHDTGNAD